MSQRKASQHARDHALRTRLNKDLGRRLPGEDERAQLGLPPAEAQHPSRIVWEASNLQSMANATKKTASR